MDDADAEHGGDGERVAARLGRAVEDMVDLSASLNPYALDATQLAVRHLGALRRYPDPDRATRLLADTIGVDGDRLVLTNGGAEAIALVAAEVRRGAIVEPEFSLYRRHLETVTPTAGRWRSNPANPLGRLALPSDTAAVWDEAFYPLATGAWTRGDSESWRLGSLTKLWACPGLRLGYVIAPTAVAARAIAARQPRWAVSSLALALVDPLLHATELTEWATSIARLRDHFARELGSLGFAVTSTDANWVLVSAHDLREALIPQGIVVRDCTSFGLPNAYRVALPHPRQLDRVLAAFATVADQLR
jgi:threonine-phosphate decarboxylase